MVRRLLGALSVAFALLALPSVASADPALPPGFQDEVVFDGREQPTNFRFAEDGRVFVAEKPGRIWVYEDLEDDAPTLFADLRASVYDREDRGLLGLELDPEFTEGRPYVYALYTWDHVLGDPWDPADPEYGDPGVSGDPACPEQNTSTSCLVSGRLVRLTEDPLTPDKSEYEGGFPKEKGLLQGWCQQFSSHSVGELQFGTEGALYVSGGDGANFESVPDYGQLGTPPYENACGDPPSPAGTPLSPPNAEGGALRSQNLELLNGAILRVNPDTGAAFPGNPLAASGNENTRRTIAKGFRNPFRFTFDPATGEIYSGNVGSSEIEEIDRFQAPPTKLFNSGWPCFEGIERQYQFRDLGLDVCEEMYDNEPESAALPFFTFSHLQAVVPGDECPFQSGSAIGGISLYEGVVPSTAFPAKYKGSLFFADPVRGCIWVMYPGEDGRPDPTTTERFMREGRVYPAVKIAEGPDGYLYYASLFSEEGLGEGAIHRIAYRPDSPTARLEAKPPYGLYDGGGEFETVLDAGKSSDPNGDILTYEWDLDEDGVFELSGSDKAKELTFTEAEQETREGEGLSPNRVIVVRVKDASFSSLARVTVYPGDKPPTVEIVDPEPDFRWSVGDEIFLWANAKNAKGEDLEAPLHYYWETRLAHCPDPKNATACHVHPLQTFAGIRGPELVGPQHDFPSYIEAVLRVSDFRGLSGVASMEIHPRTIDLTINSNPQGVSLLASTTEALSPFTVPAIDGSEILLSAPQTATLTGQAYAFSSWSDGKPRAHAIKVEAGKTNYTATYTAAPSEENPPSPPPPAPPTPPLPSPPPAVPETKLDRRPAAKTTKTVATFSFSASVIGAGFRCKLDGKPATACRSPKTYRKLKPGRHSFKVWATSGVLVDPTPAKFSWKITPPPKRRSSSPAS